VAYRLHKQIRIGADKVFVQYGCAFADEREKSKVNRADGTVDRARNCELLSESSGRGLDDMLRVVP
jgi:hypothetical protein